MLGFDEVWLIDVRGVCTVKTESASRFSSRFLKEMRQHSLPRLFCRLHYSRRVCKYRHACQNKGYDIDRENVTPGNAQHECFNDLSVGPRKVLVRGWSPKESRWQLPSVPPAVTVHSDKRVVDNRKMQPTERVRLKRQIRQ